MIRVADLDRSLAFYVKHLGMRVLRREDYPDGRFTLVFLGYGGADGVTLELTHNWDGGAYALGNAFGHIALGVSALHGLCKTLQAQGVVIVRPPGPMKHASDGGGREMIAFIEDPDGYPIELIETAL